MGRPSLSPPSTFRILSLQCPHNHTIIQSHFPTNVHPKATKNRLGDAEADKQRLQKDLDDRDAKIQWLQKINSQV